MLNNLFQNLAQTRSSGLTIKDIHYKIIRADKYSIYGKKVKKVYKHSRHFFIGENRFV